MSSIAIQASSVSKRYPIGAMRRPHDTLRDAIAEGAKRLFSLAAFRERKHKEEFWALHDVSFTINRGEVLGIIGRNGAGKTTLLKILSRITEPTAGEVHVFGRVGSLLEVGTGFHSELTGRENIFLNGAILGMTRKEIERKFDEIVAFAEVERFIDTPVKHYSSGMYLRLGFSVAAHLEPDILIVDEVLAVGDAEFQKKCLGKMEDVSNSGRTVLFVSHNLAAVRSLCSRGIVLDGGRVTTMGSVQACMAHYAARQHQPLSASWKRPADKPEAALTIDSVALEVRGAQPRLILVMEITLSSRAAHKPALIAVDIRDVDGTPVMQALPEVEPFIVAGTPECLLELEIELLGMIPGRYSTTVWVGSHNEETFDTAEETTVFEIHESPTHGRTYPHTTDHGYVVPTSHATVRRLKRDG